MSLPTAFVTAIQHGLGDRARLLRDPEGFPFVPARYGRIEWRGPEWNGGQRLYAYTDHVSMISRLRKVPGLHPKQIGTSEAVFWLEAADHPTLTAVGQILRPRQRRVLTPEQRADLSRRGFQTRLQSDLSAQEGPQ